MELSFDIKNVICLYKKKKEKDEGSMTPIPYDLQRDKVKMPHWRGTIVVFNVI